MHIPIVGSDEVADVTGAGDTVIATVTLALASGASYFEAAHLANIAGGLVVMKRGTATVSGDELRAAHRGRTRKADPRLEGRLMARVLSQSELIEAIAPIARPAGPSRSPTAASICSTSATSATCRAPPRRPIASWWR